MGPDFRLCSGHLSLVGAAPASSTRRAHGSRAARAFLAMAHTMEGFLEKKGSGGSVVGRTNWLKRWFVLDGSHLT